MDVSIRTLSRTVIIAVVCVLSGFAPALAAETQAAQVFSSPDEAMKALVDAAKANDNEKVASVFGSGTADVLDTGDQVLDKNRRQRFLERCGEKLVIERKGDDTAIALIGKEDWPFPIPMVRVEGGWSFDLEEGRQEIINRFVGKNELTAIETCRKYVEAQQKYHEKDRDGDGLLEYAQKFVSEHGKKDGLYWPAAPGESPSPLAPFAEVAQAEGYGRRVKKAGEPSNPYNGYYFRILTRQGPGASGGRSSYLVDADLTKGFALLAYPTRWGVSGVMTFLVNHEGKVYQKNLGADTDRIVGWIESFNPDGSWQVCP